MKEDTIRHRCFKFAAKMAFGLAALVVFFSIVANRQAQAISRDLILSASEIDYPPFCIVDAEGRAGGFSVELMQAALTAMGREVTFRTGSWTEVRRWLETGEIEALPLVGRTPEREAIFDFTFPYMSLYGAIVVRSDTDGIQDLADLRGKSVAVLAGDNAEEFLRRKDRGIEIHPKATFVEALQELSRGRHDAVVVQRLVALRLIQEIGLTNLKVVNQPIDNFRQDFCFAVAEGDRDTLALLNEGLALVMADGTYRHLHAKWFAALELPADRRIVVGGDHKYPPFEYLDENGRPAGYNVELTRALARELELDIEIRLGPWAEIVQGMAEGRIDILQGMFYLPERDLKFDFTQAHTVHHFVSVVRQGEGPPPAVLDDLAGKRVVVQRGDAAHDFLMGKDFGGRIALAESLEEALRELAEGKHDCALAARISSLYLIEQHGWKNLILGRQVFLPLDYCYAAPNGHKAVLAQFSEGLNVLEKSGEYRRIYDAWLGVYDAPEQNIKQILRAVAVGAGVLLAVVLVLFAWTWTLRRQVGKQTEALRLSSAKFKDVFESANVGKSITLPTGEIDVNQAYAEFLGYRQEELRGKTWRDLTPVDEIETVQTHLDPLLAGEKDSLRFEKRYLRKDGACVWADVSTTLRRGPQGQPLYFVTTVVDINARMQAEAALRQSEAFQRAMITCSPVALFSINLDGTVTSWNPSAEKIFGWTAEDIVGRPLPIVQEDKQPEFDALRRQVASGGQFSGRELIRRRKDGTPISISLSAAQIRDTTGHITGIMGAAEDITERRQAEEALLETEGRFKTIFEKSPHPMALTDVATGQMIEVNDQFCRKVGIEKEQLLGRTTTELGFYSPASRATFVERLEKQGKVQDLEMSFQTPSQTYLTRMHADFVTIANKQYLLTTFEDITARRQSEDALRESEQRLHAILESGANPTVVYNAEGFPQYLNPAFTRVFGWTREELAGQRIPFVPDDQKGITTVKIQEIYATGDPVKFATQRLTKDGRRLDVIVSAAIIKSAEGKGTGMVVSLTDVSEQKSLELQLRQAQKMESVGRLAGGVAHDFNNMLGVILGYGELALGKVAQEHPLHADLTEIITAARRSADITRQLLAFARRQTVAPRVIDLNATIEGMLRMLRRLIGEDIDLQWLPKGGLCPVKIDPTQVDQLLANLCVNARDAIGGVGKITIETENVRFDQQYCRDHRGFVVGDYLLLAVSDDGSGIDAETRDHLFEPFFSTKGIGQGTGLGLATVYGIVKQNNGFINVYSEPGKGTTFRIYLPRHAGEAEKTVARDTAEIISGHGETILIVEDEVSILKLAEKLLLKLGYTVLSAASPRAAIALAEGRLSPIHLLITDVVMPDMNGRDLARQIQALCPGLKVLFMSGYTADVIAKRGVLETGVHFLQKPFSMEDLAVRVSKALG